MQRLDNFSEVKNLSMFVVNHKEYAEMLSEIAYYIWENKETSQLYDENKKLIDKLISEQYIRQNSEQAFEFKDMLHFEFFYSINFITNNLLFSGKNLSEITDLLWVKVHRQKSKNGSIKLSYDFSPICLINIHNYFNFDIIYTAKIEYGTYFQKLKWDFYKALPYLNSLSSNVYDLLKFLLINEADHYISQIANAIGDLSSMQSEIGVELLEYIDIETDEKIKRITPAILIGLTSARGSSFTLPLIILKLQSNHEYDVKNALFILSRFNFSEEDWVNYGKVIAEHLDLLENSFNENYKTLLPDVYVQHIKLLLSAKEHLIEYSKSDNPQYQLAMSNIMWFRGENLHGESWFETALLNSSKWDYLKPDIANNMKFCLLGLIKKNAPLSIKYLTAWIANKNNSILQIQIFNDDISTLFGDNQELMEEWLTISFKSPDIRFHQAMSIVISNLWVDGLRYPSLSKKILDNCSFWDIKYILYKIMANVHSKESLESLVFSILKKEPSNEPFPELIANAFIQYISYNYGGTYSFLKEKEATANDVEKYVIKRVTENYDRYFRYIKEIGHIQELKWQTKKGVSFTQRKMKRMSNEMRKSMEKTEENSIRSLFRTVNLKGGKKFFSKYEGVYTQPAEMKDFGSSFEMPRGEMIDPIRERLNMIGWNNYKIKL